MIKILYDQIIIKIISNNQNINRLIKINNTWAVKPASAAYAILWGIRVNPNENPATKSETASNRVYFGNQFNIVMYLTIEKFDLSLFFLDETYSSNGIDFFVVSDIFVKWNFEKHCIINMIKLIIKFIRFITSQ